VLQWVVSGLAEVAPSLRKARPGDPAGEPLNNRERRQLRGLRAQAKRTGERPETVVLPKPRPPPPRLSPSRLDLLAPPSTMDAAALGRAASTAARDLAGSSPSLWAALGQRAREVLPTLDTQDLAMLLKGMARARHDDAELMADLRKRAVARIAYFSSRHFAMVFSALARLDLPHEDRSVFVEALQDRMPEFQNAGELTMVAVALGRLRVADPPLLAQLSARVEARLSAGKFHARELASVSAAYVRLQHLVPEHLEVVAACATITLQEATARELASLVLAAAQAGAVADGGSARAKLAATALGLAAEKGPFMLPVELVDAAVAFGRAMEASLCDASEVGLFLRGVAQEVTRSPGRLSDHQLVALLQSFERWQVPIDTEGMARLTDSATTRGPEFLELAGVALPALARQLQTDTGGGDCRPTLGH